VDESSRDRIPTGGHPSSGRTIRIGAGQGTAGDSPEGVAKLIDAGCDYLCFESLAELVMARLTEQKAADPEMGYAADVAQYLRPALRAVAEGRVKMITNAGGLNPAGAARMAARIAAEQGLCGLRIATVSGDDVSSRLGTLRGQGADLAHAETGAAFSDFPGEPLFASTYLGARPVVDALDAGAQIVFTGRITDATLFLAPLIYEHGWRFDDWDRLATGVLLGHLMECSGQVAGGNYAGPDWWQTPEPWNVPFPMVDVAPDGTAILSKPASCGGRVSFDTVRHQLLYEVQDPSRYLNPDVVSDFTSPTFEDLGEDRVRIRGVRGFPAPATYKALLGVETGWAGEIRVGLSFPHAWEKARTVAAIFRKRVEDAGLDVLEWRVEYFGLDALGGATVPEPSSEPGELLLRVAFRCRDEATALAVRGALTPLYLSAPAAGVGVIHSLTGAGRSPSRQSALWPTLIEKTLVDPHVRVTLGEVEDGKWHIAEEKP